MGSYLVVVIIQAPPPFDSIDIAHVRSFDSIRFDRYRRWRIVLLQMLGFCSIRFDSVRYRGRFDSLLGRDWLEHSLAFARAFRSALHCVSDLASQENSKNRSALVLERIVQT